MRRDPIVMQDYDPGWPALFARERERLERVLQPWLVQPIEHIGSTSIPGLAAKPIIDMLALVDDYDAFAEALPLVEPVGWTLAPEPGDVERRKYSLCYPDIAHRSRHLHVVEKADGAWPEWILFRDYLREHPDVAAEYGELKRRLAVSDPHDRPAYRAAKAPFIRSTLREAKRWRRG